MRVRMSRKMSVTSLVTGQWCTSQSGNPGEEAIWGNMDFLWNCIPWGLTGKVTSYGAMIPEFFY